jgi:hypothetical protein
MVQLSATRCSCIAILWVSIVSFAAITLCVVSQRVIPKVSVYFVIDSVRELSDTPSYTYVRSWMLNNLCNKDVCLEFRRFLEQTSGSAFRVYHGRMDARPLSCFSLAVLYVVGIRKFLVVMTVTKAVKQKMRQDGGRQFSRSKYCHVMKTKRISISHVVLSVLCTSFPPMHWLVMPRCVESSNLFWGEMQLDVGDGLPDVEGSCEYIQQAIGNSWQWVVLRLEGWTRS